MQFKRVYLTDSKRVYIDAYIADKIEGFTRKAILVIPGGGYSMVCSDREGEPIAMAFMAQGYNAFVLNYTTYPDAVYPQQLIEASMAIKNIKDNSAEYGINPDEIFAVGFSAGGHLVASLGTMWHKKEVYDAIDMPYGYNKIKGMMLIYPVISYNYHKGSINNLLGCENPTQEDLDKVNIENNVDENAVPMYLVHTSNDEIVNVKNALAVANAYAQRDMMFEMHIYPDAPHGVALANAITKCGNEKWDNAAIAKWVENAVYWANNL